MGSDVNQMLLFVGRIGHRIQVIDVAFLKKNGCDVCARSHRETFICSYLLTNHSVYFSESGINAG